MYRFYVVFIVSMVFGYVFILFSCGFLLMGLYFLSFFGFLGTVFDFFFLFFSSCPLEMNVSKDLIKMAVNDVGRRSLLMLLKGSAWILG